MCYPILAQTPVSYVYSQFSKHEISRSRLLIEIVLPLEQCHMLHLGKPNYDSKYSNSVVIQRILLCLNFYCYCNYRFCWTLLANYPILQSQFESTSIVETGKKPRLARTFETWNYRNCFFVTNEYPKTKQAICTRLLRHIQFPQLPSLHNRVLVPASYMLPLGSA